MRLPPTLNFESHWQSSAASSTRKEEREKREKRKKKGIGQMTSVGWTEG
jgi:hypothetical protein